MRCYLLLATAAIPLLTLAQTGANSTCATAMELEASPTNVQLTLLPMTGDWFSNALPNPVTACSGNMLCLTGWFKFTATATKHWLRTEGGDNDAAIMEAFSGTCGSLTSIACHPQNSANMELSGLTIGSTYFFRVQMQSNPNCSSNDCQTWIAVVSAPANDDCSGAIELPVTSGAVQAWPTKEVSSLGATQSQTACGASPDAANDDVWFRFTATNAAHFFQTASLNGAQDNVVQWFSGSCGNLTSIGCDVDYTTGLTPGTQYYIRAYSESTDPNINFRVLADVLAPAPNDECAGAFPVEVTMVGEEPKPVSLSTIHATSSTVPCDVQPHDVWISFVAPGTNAFVVTESQGNAGVFSGSCGALVCHTQGQTDPGLELTGLTPGATYYVKVDASAFSRKNGKVWVFAPDTNADCTTAIDLEVQTDPVAYTHGHLYASTEWAWYRFTATRPRMLVDGFTTAGTGPIGCRVYTGACGSQTQVAISNGLYNTLVIAGLEVGQQVYIRVEALQPKAFRIAVREPMDNDGCEGALELPFSTPQDYASIPQVNSILADDGTGGCMPYKDLWYRFTAAHTSAGMMIHNGAGTMEWYSGTCGALTSLGCATNTPKALFSGLVPGTEYHIRVSSSAVGMRFTPMLFDQPLNDGIPGAITVPFGTTFAQPLVQYWNFGASETMPGVCQSGADEDTWFTFTATAANHGVVATQANMFFNETAFSGAHTIVVYDTVVTDVTLLNAHQIACGPSPRVLTGLTIGKQYLYRVYHGAVGGTGTCGFISCVTISNNNEPDGAFLLAYTDGYSASFGTAGATQSLPGADCQVDDTADDDIWFKFVATSASARLAIEADVDVTIELFSGVPNDLTSIACDGNILELPTLTPGQTYHARVYSRGNAVAANGRIGLITTPSLTANGCVDEACLGPVLVPNPGIEQGAGDCPILLAEVGEMGGLGTQLAPGWPRMQGGSSDAFHSCTSAQSGLDNPGLSVGGGARRTLSRSGKGMGGFIASDFGGLLSYTEYLQAPLSEPLVPGEAYLVSFHVTTGRSGFCLSGLGAALSVGPLAQLDQALLNVTPAAMSTEVICTDDWVNICGVFVPDTPVDHVTVGAFLGAGFARTFGTSSRSYYFLDDVVVARINDPSCITSIGDVPPLDEDANGGGDDLRVYPNPANDRVNIVGGAGLFGERAVLEVFDITGKRMHAEEVSRFLALQPLDLPAEWKEGLYLLMVRVEGRAPKAARVVVKR